MDIRILEYKEIDLKRWDKCIDSSLNGTVFGYSWYLNLVCDHWEAIVLNDYEAVMPLPVSRIMNHPAIISPCFVPQLGVFSPRLPGPEMIDTLLARLRSRYRYIKMGLNKYNLISDEAFRIRSARAYNLDLITSYSRLSHHFSRETKQVIETGTGEKFTVMKGLRLQEFIQFYRTHTGRSSPSDDDLFYNRLRRIISFSILHRFGDIFGAYSPENNLSAAGFVMNTARRITCLVTAMEPGNRGKTALTLLTDHLLRQYSERNVTVDFEMLPCHYGFRPGNRKQRKQRDPAGIYCEVFAGFGAKMFNYPVIIFNRLPWPLKTLQKILSVTSSKSADITV